MKVYQVQPGAGLDGLSIDERPEPTPAPRQVLIKVKAVSLNASLKAYILALPSPWFQFRMAWGR